MRVTPVKEEYLQRAQRRLDSLTKPAGSLGRLEDLAKRYVAIRENERPTLDRKVVFTFAADHGVAARGVSAYPREVTPQMVLNFLRGGAGVNVLAKHIGAEVKVVDIGVDHEFGDAPGLIERKVRKGTDDMTAGPAMTRDEVRAAVDVGAALADEAKKDGVDIIGTGDMGIGNTTASSAITSVITGIPVDRVTGRGTGIDDETLRKKIAVIEAALRMNSPDPGDPMDVLAKVGGLEIAGIAGLILGSAERRIPVVLDGFISGAAALAACELVPDIKGYLFASHLSQERGHRAILDRIGVEPILDLNLRLGEGTGACLGISLVEASVRIYNEMATFGEAGVSEKI